MENFDLLTTGPEDVLVTCDEGDVLCTDDQGRELHAIPGVVVEKRPGELYRTAAVAAADLPAYARQWSADRADALQRNALRLILANARLYATISRDLRSVRANLERNSALLSKWKDENRQGRIGQRPRSGSREPWGIKKPPVAGRPCVLKFPRLPLSAAQPAAAWGPVARSSTLLA